MSVLSTMGSLFGLDRSDTTRAQQAAIARQAATPLPYAEQYALLRYYYANNGLWDRLSRAQTELGLWTPARRGLRNPARRICEFYTAHLWPGDLPDALPIMTPEREQGEPPRGTATHDARLKAAIEQVWAWSNWGAKKQVMARWLPMLGDVFLKVVGTQARGRVYFELVDPAYVTAFDTDERGYLTWVRIDVPIPAPADADTAASLLPRWSTEVWSKADQTYQRWVHQSPPDTATGRLGSPQDTRTFAQMGVADFVPIVHAKFCDLGELRGVGAFTLAIDKIDEVNLKATRLSQMLFRHNRNTWALEGEGRDPRTGQSTPPPHLGGRNGTAREAGAAVVVGDEDMFSLPSGWHLKSMVPDLHYDAALAAIAADLLELQQDCPEMAYWHITEQTADLSGRAIRFMLGPAITRLLEVRGNAEDALIRADAMALTIGQAMRLPAFRDLGDYARGDFEHRIADREVVPLSELEQAQAAQAQADAAVKQLAAGWSQRGVWRGAGLDDVAIEQMEQEKAEGDVLQETEL